MDFNLILIFKKKHWNLTNKVLEFNYDWFIREHNLLQLGRYKV